MSARAKILVVEDEGMIAFAAEQALIAYGFDVVGPAPNTRKALKLLSTDTVDVAVLDVNLGDERVDAVADALAIAAIPFIFSTGYSDRSIRPPGHQDRPKLTKPYDGEQLRKLINQLLAARTLVKGAVMA